MHSHVVLYTSVFFFFFFLLGSCTKETECMGHTFFFCNCFYESIRFLFNVQYQQIGFFFFFAFYFPVVLYLANNRMWKWNLWILLAVRKILRGEKVEEEWDVKSLKNYLCDYEIFLLFILKGKTVMICLIFFHFRKIYLPLILLPVRLKSSKKFAKIG